jgi:dienelactone hydrolase
MASSSDNDIKSKVTADDTFRPCCLEGYIDFSAEPRGKVIKVGNIDTYVSAPTVTGNDLASSEGGGRVIGLLADVWGIASPNLRIMADRYADRGFMVYAPDLFDGSPASSSSSDALVNFSRPQKDATIFTRMYNGFAVLASAPSLISVVTKDSAKTRKAMDSFLLGLRKDFNIKNIGLCGYCFGGRWSALCGVHVDSEDSPYSIVSAVVPTHASMSNAEVAAIEKPALFILAGEDFAPPKEADVKAANPKAKTLVFPGVYHGFAIRGHPEDKEIVSARNLAIVATSKHFVEHVPINT